MNKSKVCSCCKTRKDESEFAKNILASDGLELCCKQCAARGSVHIDLVQKVRQERREKVAARWRTIHTRRRAQIARGTFTLDEWYRMLVETNHTCVYCGKQSNHIGTDHIVPLSRGGRHETSNIVPACPSCNSKKNNKDLLIFLRENPAIYVHVSSQALGVSLSL